jgi:hypothetical protein
MAAGSAWLVSRAARGGAVISFIDVGSLLFRKLSRKPACVEEGARLSSPS